MDRKAKVAALAAAWIVVAALGSAILMWPNDTMRLTDLLVDVTMQRIDAAGEVE